MRFTALILSLVLAVGYPFLVYFTLGVVSPRVFGGLLLGLYLVRLFLTDAYREPLQRQVALLGLAVIVVPTVLNQAALFLYVPVALNLIFLAVFLRSLISPPAIVEVFAQKYIGILSAEQVRYCRAVTWSWVALFCLNGGIAFLLAWRADLQSWMLFNGFIAYFLIGGLFVAELIYRHWRFRHYVGLPTDFLFKRIFPPRDVTV